jgi:hypothetical protein
MMPDLVRGPAPRKISFAVSLPHSVLATASLLCAAPAFEGLGDWLLEARVLLPHDLLAELCLLVTFPGGYQRFTGELAARLTGEAEPGSFERMLDRLRALSGDQYQQMALRALAKGSPAAPSGSDLWDLLSDRTSCAEYLSRIESDWAPEAIASLVFDGAQFKQRVLTALSRFWHECYAKEYAATRPLMERSVTYQKAQSHSPRFEDLFVNITGRLVPDTISSLIDGVDEIRFIPSCYVGPYVAYTHQDSLLIIYYNCRSTPASTAKPSAGDRAGLYPPLKALADETRLQILTLLHGQECYAQEIVDQLGLSQPAVSRHLNLMATAGVLSIRREGNTKYYTINTQTLAQLARALQTFL